MYLLTKAKKKPKYKEYMDLCSPLPDLSLSVSRTGKPSLHTMKSFLAYLGSLMSYHETNFKFSSTQNICSNLCLLNYPPETLPNEFLTIVQIYMGPYIIYICVQVFSLPDMYKESL
jgi:hypothetical protein